MTEERGLETLQVWQKAMAFAINIQQIILSTLPLDEKWALTSQLRRSAQSIPANIAEGYGRYYFQEGVRFCYIARGSLEETYTHISLAHKLGYISQDTFNKFNVEIQDIRRLLNGYINFLKKSKRGENEPGSTHQIQDDSFRYIPDVDVDDPIT
jgi:four helix bundle protein